MYKRSLPAVYASGENKGKTAEVQIANESIGFPADVRDDEGNILEARALRIPQAHFVYPQFGPEPKTEEIKDKDGKVIGTRELPLTEDEAKAAIEEAAVDAGGWVKLAAIHNDNTADEAVKEAKNYIRQFKGTPETNADDVVRVGLKKSSEFTWKTAEKITTAQLKQELQSLKQENVDEMDPEELKRRMKALLAQV